jgi:hypothetical protein
MALKLKAKQEKCTYTVQDLKTYKRIRCMKKEGISAFVHNWRRKYQEECGG